MSHLLDEWTEQPISAIANFVRGVTYKKPQAKTGPGAGLMPLLRATNIHGNALHLDSELVFVPSELVKNEQHLRKGDVVIATSSGSSAVVGKSGRLVHDWEGTFGAFCAVLRAKNGVSPEYLSYYLQSDAVRREWSQAAQGTNINNLKRTDIGETVIPVAPLDAQERIVEVIEEEFSRLDAGVASLRRSERNLARLRASVLKSAIEGRLVAQDSAEGQGQDLVASILEDRRQRWREGQPSKRYKEPQEPSQPIHDAPESWGIASLESLTDPMRVICYGILKPKTDGELTVPYVEVRDIRDGRIDVAGLNRTTQELHSQFPRSHLKAGDVLIAVRGSYDRSAVVPSELAAANISRDVARLAPLEGLVPEFLALYLHSPPVLAHFRRIARGVAVKGINISSIRELTIRIPPVAEQSRIVIEVDRQHSILSALTETVRSALLHCGRLRRAVLEDAFAGRLIPSSRHVA